MRKFIAGLCAVTVLGFAVSALYAQGEKPKTEKAPLPTAFGKVLELDKAAKTLKIEARLGRGKDAEKKEMTFTYTDETKVVESAGRGAEPKPATIDDVKVDTRVMVIYKEAAGDAKPVALNIRIVPAGAGKTPKAGG